MVSPPRHVLPSDLPTAVKHLDDQELAELHAAVVAELEQRGKKPTEPGGVSSKRTKHAESVPASLTVSKLNAVRAAFRAGVTPARIAKQFGVPQAEVRKAIASKE